MRKAEIQFEKQGEGRQSEARGEEEEVASRPIHLPVYAFNSKAKDSTMAPVNAVFVSLFQIFGNSKVKNSRTNNHAKKQYYTQVQTVS